MADHRDREDRRERRTEGRESHRSGCRDAGLLVARALYNHFRTIIILDKDPEAGSDRPRAGAGQRYHVHPLLRSGLDVIEDYFPGIIDEMTVDGMRSMDFAADFLWRHFGVYKLRFASDFVAYSQTCPARVAQIYRHVLAEPNIDVWSGVRVERLLPSQDNGRAILGVRVQDAEGEPRDMHAKLVVGASGQGTRSIEWLAGMGFPRPPREPAEIDIAYVMRLYEQPEQRLHDWLAQAVRGAKTHGLARRYHFQMMLRRRFDALRRIAVLADRRPHVHRRFLRVIHLLDSPAALFYPVVLWPVLFGPRKKVGGQPQLPLAGLETETPTRRRFWSFEQGLRSLKHRISRFAVLRS